MQGPFEYQATLPRITGSPLYMVVAPAGRVGFYSVAIAGPGGDAPPVGPIPPDPIVPPDPIIPPPEPPPAPPSPTDDVPTGTEHDFTAAGFFQGLIEVPGDHDVLVYTVPANGSYEVRLTSEMADAVGDAAQPLAFQLNSWVAAPHFDVYTAGTQIRVTVHSLSELTGSYRLAVTPPGTPPPPVLDPLPDQPIPPLPDLNLGIDPVTGMPPKPASNYQSWLNQNYRFTDPSINGETVDALAMRDRWIQKDNGAPSLKLMNQDPTGAFGSALAPFGGKSNARTRFPNWVRTQANRMVVGGGSLEQIRTVVETGMGARRPLLLLGKREGTGLVEAWVVIGWKSIGGVSHLVALDPSMPGQMVNLPLGPGGLLPVNSGGAILKNFTLLGQAADVIYP
jgi:hypothetical protein